MEANPYLLNQVLIFSALLLWGVIDLATGYSSILPWVRQPGIHFVRGEDGALYWITAIAKVTMGIFLLIKAIFLGGFGD